MTYEFLILGVRHTAQTLAEVSATYERLQAEHLAAGGGVHEFPSDRHARVRICGAMLPFARISWNGRIWRDTPWQPGDTPIYDNRPADFAGRYPSLADAQAAN